jgi:hypothetical protein
VRELRSLRGLRRQGRIVLHALLAACVAGGACTSVVHASSYYLQTLHRIRWLEEVFERYREKTGKELPLEGDRTWASHLLWDLGDDWFEETFGRNPCLFSETDPSLQSKPADVVIHDGWCNPVIVVKDGDRLLIYSRGQDEIDDRGLLDDISNRWGFRAGTTVGSAMPCSCRRLRRSRSL